MKFKKVIRGYDPKEVDKHITETAAKEQEIRASQRERIEELLEENRTLRKLAQQYHADENAISKSLIDSNSLADDIKREADEYCERALTRAKIFCASWRAYAKTLVATLSDEEVREFNALQRKIESIVSVYEGKKTEASEPKKDGGEERATVAAAEAKNPRNVEFTNPISRIEGFSEQTIDLKELIAPEQSLEEICAELGLTHSKK